MENKQKMCLKDDLIVMLDGAVSSDYIEHIADNILDDVAEDIESTADKDYNVDDIRLSVGRVLCDKLHIVI